MRNYLLLACAFPVVALWQPPLFAQEHVVKAKGASCKQRLYDQPGGGPFAVFLFCDDAAGSNIGVVNVASGAGPGKIKLAGDKRWDMWAPNARFWQDVEWATDVTSFAWSADLKYLYVGTSSVYGTGGLYRLDLVNRTSMMVMPSTGGTSGQVDGTAHATEIVGYDRNSGMVEVDVQTFAGRNNTLHSKQRVK